MTWAKSRKHLTTSTKRWLFKEQLEINRVKQRLLSKLVFCYDFNKRKAESH